MTCPDAIPDLPLVSKEIGATFDVVGRATGKPMRITLLATVGVPYDEEGAAGTDGVFDVRDFDGSSTLDYLRLGSRLYVLRFGLDRYQKPFRDVAHELEELQGVSENRYVMERTSRHGVTGAKVNSWNTDPKGRVGDSYLGSIYDMRAVPARVEELRAVVARNVLLTSRGLAYRQPYPSWVVSNQGDVVALSRPSRSAERAVHAFGLDRREDALEMARRLGGEPQVLGRVVQAPGAPGPDVSARDAAVRLAESVREILGPRLAELPDGDVVRWHDCANAEAILDSSGGDGLKRVLTAARALARGHAGEPGFKASWKWDAYHEARTSLELGEPRTPVPAGPRP